MPLGTLDRTPPPFFRQGPTARTKLLFYAALSVLLMVADVRWKLMEPTRAAAATVLLPVQRVLHAPLRLWEGGAGYLQALEDAQADAVAARQRAVVLSSLQAERDTLHAENDQLRALLDLRPTQPVPGVVAQVLFEARDPFSRKVMIDRGGQQGLQRGSPVINDQGVLGQVTRVYPLSAEVTLLTDRDASIPVLNTRTLQRAAAFGGAGGSANPWMELRFLAGNADVREGDELITSGLDAIYPPGLKVASVVNVSRQGGGGFAQVLLEPAARAEGVRFVMVLAPYGDTLPVKPERVTPQTTGGAVKGPALRPGAKATESPGGTP